MSSTKSAVLLLCAMLLAPCVEAAPKAPAPCKPCGEWTLDAAATESAAPIIDAALSRYKPPRRRRISAPRDDIAAQTAAEFEASLDEPVPGGPGSRNRLRENLARLLEPPGSLRLRQDGDDIVIEARNGATRRVTPGEPHARVDELGTAEIVSQWRGGGLTVTESYRRKVFNRETYVVDAQGRLLVTRTISRTGLPPVVVHSTYEAP